MAKSNSNNDDSAWSWLTKTWLGPVLSLIVLVSSPLAFAEKRGLAWTTAIAAVATWFWWSTAVLKLRLPRIHGDYSRKGIFLWSLLPAALTVGCVALIFLDVKRLNIWREDFREPTITAEQSGRVAKYFEHTATRTTAAEKDEYERAEWVRWMAAGAAERTDGAELLFVKTAAFTKRYHTFSLEIHDPLKGIQPCASCAAFLVADEPGSTWRRRVIRQVPCDSAGNFDTRLFRVQVENPTPGEYLWLFL